MLRITCILILCAVFIHVCSSRNYSRRHNQAADLRSRKQLKMAVDELTRLTENSHDKYELQELSKMIDTADQSIVQFGENYLRYINYLIAKKKENRHRKLNANHTRRFLSWFKNIIKPNPTHTTSTTSRNIPTKTTIPTTRTTITDLPIVTKEWPERVSDANLTETLNKLIDVLYKLNDNINKSNNETLGYYVVKVPVSVTTINNNKNDVPLDRFKRAGLEIQTEAIVDTAKNNETIKMNASNVENNNTKHVEDRKSELQDVVTVPVVENVKRKRNKRDVSSPMIDLTVNKVSQNKTEDLQNATTILDSMVTNVTNDLLNRANTRRNFSPQNNIRAKLFSHLYDIFDEIKLKLDPVVRIKNEYSNNVAFKIGYISANLDTLGSNLVRLREDMEENGRAWSDSKVLELFDVLKIHHGVVMKLLDSLRQYLHVKPEYSFD